MSYVLLPLLLMALLLCHSHGATFASPQKEMTLKDLAVKQKQIGPGMTNLRFQASTNYVTQPVKYDARLTEFFLRDEHCDLLLAGGSHNQVERLKFPDSYIYRLWEMEATRNGVVKPVVGDSVYRVTTTGIHFPGITRKTMATVGCKKVVVHDHPELQITLICDELQAIGPEPLVWVFHQMTGGSNKENRDQILNPFSIFDNPTPSDRSERTTHSTNIIRAEVTSHDDGVVFRSMVCLAIDVSFPSLLLNILPVSKSMAEKQGSDTIRKVIKRDIGPSLEALRKHYMDLVVTD